MAFSNLKQLGYVDDEFPHLYVLGLENGRFIMYSISEIDLPMWTGIHFINYVKEQFGFTHDEYYIEKEIIDKDSEKLLFQLGLTHNKANFAIPVNILIELDPIGNITIDHHKFIF